MSRRQPASRLQHRPNPRLRYARPRPQQNQKHTGVSHANRSQTERGRRVPRRKRLHAIIELGCRDISVGARGIFAARRTPGIDDHLARDRWQTSIEPVGTISTHEVLQDLGHNGRGDAGCDEEEDPAQFPIGHDPAKVRPISYGDRQQKRDEWHEDGRPELSGCVALVRRSVPRQGVVTPRTGIVEFAWYVRSMVASHTTNSRTLGFKVVATTTATTISATRTTREGARRLHSGTILGLDTRRLRVRELVRDASTRMKKWTSPAATSS